MLNLIFILFIFAIVAMVILGACPEDFDSTDPIELDKIACEQMREEGISEEEIKQFMDETGGYYDRD